MAQRPATDGGVPRRSVRTALRTIALIAGSAMMLATPIGAYAANGATAKSSESSKPTPSPPPKSNPPGGLMPSPSASGDERAYEVDLRTRSGLRHDQAWIDSVDAAATSTSTELSIPLTPAESADIQGRQRLNPVMGQIERLAGESELYGGVAIDNASGGAIKIALTADPAESDAARDLLTSLKALVPQGVDVEVTVQDASLSQLDNTDNALVSDFAAGKLDEFKVNTIGEFMSGIEVTTSSDSPQDVQSRLQARYEAPFITVIHGDGVDFQVGRNQANGDL